MTDIKVTVIVAVYNVEKYLRQCMDSVCGQSLQDIEIICVDDHSTDQSPAILEQYARQDPRVRIIRNDYNRGPAYTRNTGLEIARGQYLLILDADDFFETAMLEDAYKKAVETNSDICVFNGTCYDDVSGTDTAARVILRTDLLKGDTAFSPEEIHEDYFRISFGAAWNKLIKRDLIEKYGIRFQNLPVANDLFFAYAAMAVAPRITAISKCYVHWRRNRRGSVSTRKTMYPFAARDALSALRAFLEQQGKWECYKDTFAEMAAEELQPYFDENEDAVSLSSVYHYMKCRGFEELGINCTEEADAAHYPTEIRRWIEDVTKYPLEGYLLRQTIRAREICPAPFLLYRFPRQLFQPMDKVILYGAGAVGNLYFAENRRNNYCRIVDWVDRNYEEYGYPINAPAEAFAQEYDYVLIAIRNREAADAIRRDLEEMDVPKSRILWVDPIAEQ